MNEIVSDSRTCTGCAACSQICPQAAITMKENKEGFLYPFINGEICNECGLCKRICPVNQMLEKERDSDVVCDAIGKAPDKKAFACFVLDDESRTKSSSGGIFSGLAIKALEKDGVVFGAGFDEKFGVRHSFVEDIENLDGLRRSKYVQSDIANTFREAKAFLDKGRHVLFCGTPCQVAGLKSYLGKAYKRLIACDLACFGVPSPRVWRMYLDYLETKQGSRIDSISFRDKSGGWKDYCMNIGFKNGERYLVPAKRELYFIGFGKNILSRSSCFDCKFRVRNSSADITLADFWGIEKMGGIIEDDNRGVSLAIAHNTAGETALNEITAGVSISQCDINEAIKYNPRLVSSAVEPAGRKPFFADMASGYDFDRLRRKYMDNVSVKYKIKCMLKSILGKG